MFTSLIKDKLGIEYEKRIIAFDPDDVISKSSIISGAENWTFSVINYVDIERFRYAYEKNIKNNQEPYLVVITDNIYLPYDIRKAFYYVDLSYEEIFPQLNTYSLKIARNLNLDLVAIAYDDVYTNYNEKETNNFIQETIYKRVYLEKYVQITTAKINAILEGEMEYGDWFVVADIFGELNTLINYSKNNISLTDIKKAANVKFKEYISNKYKTLSSLSYYKTPILVNKTLDYIFTNNTSNKFVLIIMDGMSISDWQAIASYMEGIRYNSLHSFAFIPTTTSISRQSLVSGKYPMQLENPFKIYKEKNAFIEKCLDNGYKKNQIRYHRGYDVDADKAARCMCIIINGIDDIIHSQQRGQKGMFDDVSALAKTGRVQNLISKLYKNGFTVYIGSDHGNTESICIGNKQSTGIEMESKCQKAIVYKKFADYKDTKEKFNLFEFEGTYLPKDYLYLLCEDNQAFGNKGKEIMTHGGITLEEVIVPFIEICEVD